MIKIRFSEILLKDNLTLIKNVIASDGTIIYPTDTLYGLGGNFFSLSVIKKIDSLKERSNQPYSVAISGIDMLPNLVEKIPESFYYFYERLIPGKFTFLLTASHSLNKLLLKNTQKIGVRIPDLSGLLKLIKILKVPLISTSVNKTGKKPLNDPRIICQHFSDVDLLIDSGQQRSSRGSTVLDLTQDPVKCLRKGDDYKKWLSLSKNLP